MVSTLADAGFLDFSMVCSVIMVVSLAHDVTLEFTPIWPNSLVISVALAIFFIFLEQSSKFIPLDYGSTYKTDRL